MRLRKARTVPFILVACVATFAYIKCDAKAGDSSDGPVEIRSEANVSAGGVNASGVTLENPYKDDLQSAQTGARLFSAMNCDGCHGGGALGSIGPSLVDGRWHYGGADAEIFHSIFYGRAKGMPAYGGVLGREGIWMIVTYLKSQPVPNVVPTTSYEDLATNATPTPNAPPLRVTLRPALPTAGVEGMLAKYGCTDAATYLVRQVKNGSAGVWGMIPMPAHSDIPNTDLDLIITWILTAK